MLDRYGRVINYLRISVTDRCNLRCCYCMPEGVQDVGMKNILTFEEIWEIVRTGVSLGITHIRITGGEPLVRKGCVDLIRGIREIPGVETITMTTNGVLLGNYGKQLKEAGVDGVNISLDTLDLEEFYKITGKRELQEVLAGIRAVKTAGLPVKLNAVNRKELDPIPLVRYAQEENLPLRFIEMMPVGYGKKYVGRSNEELRETLEAVCGKAECMTNREELSRMGSGPAVYYQFSDLKVPVGFISAIHGKFCDTCNRVRLTAEGYLKLCLCYDEGEDLRRDFYEKQGWAYPGGNAVNVAVYGRQLGMDAAYLGWIGTDNFGDMMQEKLKEQDVETVRMQRKQGKTAITYIELLNGDRKFGEDFLNVLEGFELSDGDLQYLAGFDCVHMAVWGQCDSCLGKLPQEVKISYDFSNRYGEEKIERLAPYIDYVFFSCEKDDAFTRDLLKRVKEQGAGLVIATLGENGSVAYDGKEFVVSGIVKADVVDTLGAGDSYIAGFLNKALEGEPLKRCMEAGAKKAALTISHFGAW